MPSQKNQHYVPKVHLRPFTTGGNGKSISLFNLENLRVINGASISGQCSSDYFYGDDLAMENLFSQIEGHYGKALREIQAGSLSQDGTEWMRMFLMFQYLRTKRAVDRTRQQVENGLLSMTARGHRIPGAEDFNTSHEAMLALTLSAFHRMLDCAQDLKLKIIKNDSGVPLVTSDAPLIFTNQFYVQQLGQNDFGAANSGAMMFLPLGEQYCAVAYDGQIYTADIAGQFISMTKANDALALNEMQYIYAHQNIYFADPEGGPRIMQEYGEVQQLRQERFFNVTEMAEAERGNGTRTFRRVETAEEADTARSRFVVFQSNHQRPRRWPSCIRYRQPKKYFFNGSGVGHVRKAGWLRGERPPPAY